MRFVAAAIATGLLLVFGVNNLCAYPLTLEQRERFKRYIPRTFSKLEARDPVHVAILGDSVTGGYTPLATAWENNNPLYSYAGGFLERLAREFFYTGGVRLLNPPEGGSDKLSEYLGDEITVENLTVMDGTALTGARRSTSDAFLHDPDLLLIQYGVYDAFDHISYDDYRRALQQSIDAGRSANVDMILLGPGLVNHGSGSMEWGLARPYSMVASEVAAANNLLFIDVGQHLARFGGGVDEETHPKAAMEIVGDRMERIFHFGPELDEVEKVHTSARANEYLTQSIFAELKDGPRVSKFSYAGVAAFTKDGEVRVTLVVRNLTSDPQGGTVGALAVGQGLEPDVAAQRFTVVGEGTSQLNFVYRRPTTGKARDGADILFPMQPTDEFCRFSFVLEDTLSSELIDLPLRVGPIFAVWKSRQYLNVSDRIRIEWDLINGSDKASAGTFQVGMGEKVGQPTEFSVSPLGTKSVFSLFDFSEGMENTPFQRDVWIQTEVNGTVVRFNRELEASRDLVLGEERELRKWSEYANAPPAGESQAQRRSPGSVTMRFDADEDALYLRAALEGIAVPDLGDAAALRARVFLDARPASEVLSFGAVEPIVVYTKGSDGPGSAPTLAPGCFGNGYNMSLSPQGVTSVLVTRDDGVKEFQMRIPRVYLHRHEWELGFIDSVLGFKVELTVADSSVGAGERFRLENSFVSHSPTRAFQNTAIYGFNEMDARSLSVLRLSRSPLNSWSVRIY